MTEDSATRAWLIRSLALYGVRPSFCEQMPTELLREMLKTQSQHEILTHQVYVADSADSGHTRTRKRRVNHADDLGYSKKQPKSQTSDIRGQEGIFREDEHTPK